MTRKTLQGLNPDSYQHPFDRKALATLQKMPGLPLLLKKINEYGIDRLLRLQTLGNEFRVNSRNFPKLHNAFIETCKILDEPVPDLYLYRGTGHISTYAIGVEKPLIGVNLETLEWLEEEELLFVFGHEIARIKGKYLTYQQLAVVMPFLKNVISSTTLGFGGLAANGIEIALYNWIMMAKFTADRAGLLACQDIDIAIASLMKLGGLPGEYLTPEVIEDFTQQAREFNFQELEGLDQVTKIFSFMAYQIPWHVMRASELLKWVETGAYTQLMESDPAQPPPQETTEESENVKDWDFLGNW
ncbi:M48 family metallopeptidase [Calothrix sp. FACHB-1219]|uniref:M48 family metallopeptidase n=1 Tax=unclassified Calothrix TaxID=2619626 RepID=UPI001685F3B3|nr:MULTISPECIES: M48 family metallopeptidase [unclassified Calothrix]MBD2203805.1 M48 family metallopeptidase [Calothrix sp. FACHB-168]MBD2219623.1 M48 family metallopeptidase [Calothrix sp. FACHB-1219]